MDFGSCLNFGGEAQTNLIDLFAVFGDLGFFGIGRLVWWIAWCEGWV